MTFITVILRLRFTRESLRKALQVIAWLRVAAGGFPFLGEGDRSRLWPVLPR